MGRNRILVVAAVWWCVLGGSLDSVQAQDWAEKMFDVRTHDFMSLARGAKAEHRFVIKNPYKHVVHISSVRSSCGCTDPRLSARSLQPGETAFLVTEFNTIRFDGAHNATVTVTFDQPYPAEVRLQIKGFVRKDVVFSPGRIELGSVDQGSTSEKTVAVTYAGRSDWKIVDVRSENENFEVELSNEDRQPGQIRYELLVRLKDTAPAGYISDQLLIVTDDAKERTIPLMINGRVVPSLSISPASLHLGVVKPGQTVTKQLVIRGRKPFKIVKIDCSDKCFQFKPDDKAKKLHLVPVIFTAGDKPGKVVQKISIQAEGIGGTPPTITAHAEVREG